MTSKRKLLSIGTSLSDGILALPTTTMPVLSGQRRDHPRDPEPLQDRRLQHRRGRCERAALGFIVGRRRRLEAK